MSSSLATIGPVSKRWRGRRSSTRQAAASLRRASTPIGVRKVAPSTPAVVAQPTRPALLRAPAPTPPPRTSDHALWSPMRNSTIQRCSPRRPQRSARSPAAASRATGGRRGSTRRARARRAHCRRRTGGLSRTARERSPPAHRVDVVVVQVGDQIATSAGTSSAVASRGERRAVRFRRSSPGGAQHTNVPAGVGGRS